MEKSFMKWAARNEVTHVQAYNYYMVQKGWNPKNITNCTTEIVKIKQNTEVYRREA